MSTTTRLITGAAALLLSIVPQIHAADSDPGTGALRGEQLGAARRYRAGETVGYRPTLHYFGKDYTVSYGFVAYNSHMLRRNPNAQGDASMLAPGEINTKSGSARVTVYRRKPATAAATKLTPVVVPTPTTAAAKPAEPAASQEAPKDAAQ